MLMLNIYSGLEWKSISRLFGDVRLAARRGVRYRHVSRVGYLISV